MNFILSKNSGCLLILLFFISCNNKAIEFNNDLVNIQESILPKMQSFSSKIQQVSEKSYTEQKLKTDAIVMINFLDKKILEISELSAPKNGENLKNSVLNQLKFERNICLQTFQLEDSNTNDDEKNKILQRFMNNEADGQKLEDKIFRFQNTYAEENNLKVEKN